MTYSSSQLRSQEYSFSDISRSLPAATTVTVSTTLLPGYSSASFNLRSSANVLSGGYTCYGGCSGKAKNTAISNSNAASLNIKIAAAGSYGGANSRQVDTFVANGYSTSLQIDLIDARYDPATGILSFQIRNSSGSAATLSTYWDGFLIP